MTLWNRHQRRRNDFGQKKVETLSTNLFTNRALQRTKQISRSVFMTFLELARVTALGATFSKTAIKSVVHIYF